MPTNAVNASRTSGSACATNAGSTTISLSALALATILAIAPVLIVFLFAQRYLVTGMTAGGTKE